MMRKMFITMAAGLAFLGSAGVAEAQSMSFSGSLSGLGLAGPDASCAPAPSRGTLDPSTSSGSSTLGSFTYGHNWCFSGASGPINGTFGLDFGEDEIFGSVLGLATPTGTPFVTDLNLTYTILGGTGLYANASGSFGGIAVSQFEPGVGSHFSLNFLGTVSTPAVPEPATWAMMLMGFAMAGFLIRRSRALKPGSARLELG
jgi:hypothetical protein